MAARRLLIVMLILLGLSTLAAALIPQRTLRDGNATQTTTRSSTTTTTPAPQPVTRALSAKIFVGGRKVPLVAGPVCAKRDPRCEPIHAGDRLSLRVASKAKGVQLEFPEFGQFGFAAQNAPARFELLLNTAGRFGILFADPESVPACRHAVGQGSPCVAARIEVLTNAAARKAIAPQPQSNGSRSASPRAP